MAPNDNSVVEQTEASTPTREKPLVLVVEDDRVAHKIVKKFLDHSGLRYVGANSAEEAMQYLQHTVPDLIFSDIQMPGVDGIQFCKHLRSMGMTRDVPVIFFTGMKDMETMSRAYEAGANDYVVKPLREIELVTRARRHIQEYQRKTAAKNKIHSLNKQNESKTRFLGVASHDLRNPLVSIRGISQFLESEKFGELNESQREMVNTIIAASESMLTLVEDLLDVSKIESDHMDINCEEIAPAELLEHASKLHLPTAEKKSINIDFIDKTEKAMALIDRKLVSRVIDNLVTNAIKFSPANTNIHLAADRENDWITVTIDDEGPGIPEDEFGKLFKEFSRTSNLPTGGESSSGIGLYVVKRIVQRHNGEVTVCNRPEGGSSFKVKFECIES